MLPRLTAIAVAAAAVALLSSTAQAQIPPSQPTPQPNTPGSEDKPEGVAEQAPKTAGKLPTVPTLPPRRDKGKEFELILVDGYFRWRGDWLKQLDLGFSDNPDDGGSTFPNPLGCQVAAGECNDTIKTSNIRLRLEPSINLGERGATTRTASVHAQIDVVDNLVLGSTPTGYFADGGMTTPPGNVNLGAFTDTQAPQQTGRNSQTDSLVVRRVWAEVFTPFGQIKVGRMPSHWGLGVLTNAGGRDPIHGTYDLDSDYGDTVDRLIFAAVIPGTTLRAAIGTDWGSTAPVASQVDLYAGRQDGQPFDLDDTDDLNQWVFAISQLDSPKDFDDKVADGETGFNYGAYVLYRTQNFVFPGQTLGGPPVVDMVVERGLKAYIPDLWLRLARGSFELEIEAAGMLGEIQDLADLGLAVDPDEDTPDIRAFGGVGRFTYKLLDGDLRLGTEVGVATGDQFDNPVPGRTHISNSALVQPAGTTPRREQGDNITAFLFNPEYDVDLILFRELLGTVTNATYVRPRLEYDFTDKISLRVQSVISFANKPVSTPGNSEMYGIEFDGDLGYQNGGFFAGIAYGVLFPLGALDHPLALTSDFTAGSMVAGRESAGDANTAQTIQFRLGLQF